jgi:hypothetical protein
VASEGRDGAEDLCGARTWAGDRDAGLTWRTSWEGKSLLANTDLDLSPGAPVHLCWVFLLSTISSDFSP